MKAGSLTTAVDTTVSRKAKPKGSPKKTATGPVKANSNSFTEPVSRIWTACFVYANAAGTANIAIKRIRARDNGQARELALKVTPGEEFVLTIIPESDEQFLGHVRLKAKSAAENRA